ncbi:MAG: hypothetical protein ABIO82_03720 [Ginsengibacter sp.]
MKLIFSLSFVFFLALPSHGKSNGTIFIHDHKAKNENINVGTSLDTGILLTLPSKQIKPPFVNDICLPSTLYMLSDVQNNIFVEPLIKRWRPYNDVVRFSGTSAYQRTLQRVATVTAPISGATVTLSLINEDEFDTVKTITSKIVVGKKGVGTDSIPVSIIGDSFTNGGFFNDALLVKGYVPKIQMIGLRDVVGFPGQFDEGRGGWTLNSHFSVTNLRTQPYNGFWQPDGLYKYWGATAFWKLANDVRTNPDSNWTFDEKYFVGRYGSCSLNFDPSTGYKLRPEKDDIMYDNALNHYLKYDGKKWLQVDYKDFNWSFNYGKYISMWKLKAPLILAEFLGGNDFLYKENPAMIDFSKWNTQMEIVISSYLKAVPKGKFVLMIPSSTNGILDNAAGDFTTKQNACMWEARKNIIENFDKRENQQIYIVDAAIAIDNLNGYNFSKNSAITKPYSEYSGTRNIDVQAGNSHPYPNYPTMGISLAAFIQAYR